MILTFLTLITSAISSVFYGFIATITIMAILYVILKWTSKSIVQTPIFFITGVILAVLLLIQITLMFGAIQAKNTAGSVEIYLKQVLENESGIVGAQDSQLIMDAVTSHFPIVGTFVGLADFSGHDFSEMHEVVHDTLIEHFNSYICHRLLWSLFIIVIACITVMLYDRRSLSTKKTKRNTTMVSRKNYDDF